VWLKSNHKKIALPKALNRRAGSERKTLMMMN
jgi:hypothetical protein